MFVRSSLLGILLVGTLGAADRPVGLLATWAEWALALQYTPDGRYVVARTSSGATIFDVSDGKAVGTPGVANPKGSLVQPAGMDVSSDGRHVALVTNGTLVVARLPYGERERVVSLPPPFPTAAVAWSPNSEQLAFQYDHLEVRAMPDLRGVALANGPLNHAWAIAFSPDGRTLASVGSGRVIEVWDARTWTLLDSLNDHPTYVSCLAFSHDGRYLATGGGGKTLILWGMARRRPVWRRDFAFCCPGQFLAYSRDGRWLVTGAASGKAMVLDARNGKVVMQWAAHDTTGVMAAAFSPDGHRLVTSGFQKGIRLWDFDELVAANSRSR